MNATGLVRRLIAIMLLLMLAWIIYQVSPRVSWNDLDGVAWSPAPAVQAQVEDFSSCVAAGNPVMESYPRRCHANGMTYVEDIRPSEEVPIEPLCVVAGCSRQLCVPAAGADVVTTCEYRDEYACYQSATCEMQADGLCGWTETPELRACLSPASSHPEASSTGVILYDETEQAF